MFMLTTMPEKYFLTVPFIIVIHALTGMVTFLLILIAMMLLGIFRRIKWLYSLHFCDHRDKSNVK